MLPGVCPGEWTTRMPSRTSPSSSVRSTATGLGFREATNGEIRRPRTRFVNGLGGVTSPCTKGASSRWTATRAEHLSLR